MRFLWIILLILQSLGPANSQQQYYIYIQSDNQQPFYSSIGKEVFSSTASGYVIIPRLKDSVYQITIGFPAERWPEYIFNCVMNKKDRGFLLKNFNEKGWGFFNLQTMEVIMGTKVEKPAEQKSNSLLPPTNDEFTVILASVVDDAELRQTELIQKDEMRMAVAKEDIKKPEEPRKDVENKETAAIVTSKSNSEVAPVSSQDRKQDAHKENSADKKEEVKKTIPAETAVIVNPDQPVTDKKKTADSSIVSRAPLFTKVVRTLQYSNKEGTEMIYVDDLLNGEMDTIRIFIPAETAPASQPVSSISNHAKTEKRDSQFLDITISPRKDNPTQVNSDKKDPAPQANLVAKDTITKSKKADTLVGVTLVEKKDTAIQLKEEKKSEPAATPITNANCKKMATDKEVSTLRSKMIVVKDEDDIVNLALKSFKQKCFSAENIKALCYIFITDQGKYKLMDAAYPYVYDQENFSGLAFLLTESYYVNRFNALVKNN